MPPLSRRRTIVTKDDPVLDEMKLDQGSEVHNIYVGSQRTSIRLRKSEWEGLRYIAQREGCSLSQVVTEIDGRRGDTSLAGALRLFAVTYFRELLRLKEAAGDGAHHAQLLLEAPAQQGERPLVPA